VCVRVCVCACVCMYVRVHLRERVCVCVIITLGSTHKMGAELTGHTFLWQHTSNALCLWSAKVNIINSIFNLAMSGCDFPAWIFKIKSTPIIDIDSRDLDDVRR